MENKNNAITPEELKNLQDQSEKAKLSEEQWEAKQNEVYIDVQEKIRLAIATNLNTYSDESVQNVLNRFDEMLEASGTSSIMIIAQLASAIMQENGYEQE